MNIDQIVTDLVEKRFAEQVRSICGLDEYGYWNSGEVQNQLKEIIKAKIAEALKARSVEIEQIIQERIAIALANISTSEISFQAKFEKRGGVSG